MMIVADMDTWFQLWSRYMEHCWMDFVHYLLCRTLAATRR